MPSELLCLYVLGFGVCTGSVEFSVFTSASEGVLEGGDEIGVALAPIKFVHISAHNAPLEELLYVPQKGLNRVVEPTYCLRTFKGCGDGFPGNTLCCHDDRVHFPHKHVFMRDGSMYREGPGETNPGHHYANMRRFFDLFHNEPTFTETDFFFCDYPRRGDVRVSHAAQQADVSL
jgi:hypothetical protein